MSLRSRLDRLVKVAAERTPAEQLVEERRQFLLACIKCMERQLEIAKQEQPPGSGSWSYWSNAWHWVPDGHSPASDAGAGLAAAPPGPE